MAHVLIGWEFGANRGHVTKIAAFAQALRSRGHQVTLAIQQIDSIRPREAAGCAIWQAPVSPRLLASVSRPASGPAATLGDILARLGFDDSDLVASMIAAWRALFGAVRPDIVCADYAPFLLLAARGLFPTVATGTGFDLPPATLATFPSLTGGAPAADEAATLASVNDALARLDMNPLDFLPEIFAADEAVAGTFVELDPYRDARVEPLAAPGIAGPVPEVGGGRGEEVFVYGASHIAEQSPLWTGLAQAGLPIRTFVPNVSDRYRQTLRQRGFQVEESAVAFGRIAERSRLLVSHGGHGFVCSGLLAGVPQVICPHDLEKTLIAAAVTRMGVGGVAPLAAIRAAPFARSLRQLYERDDIAARARAVSGELRGRMTPSLSQALTRAVERIA